MSGGAPAGDDTPPPINRRPRDGVPRPTDEVIAPGLLAAIDRWRGEHPLARLRDALLGHARGGKDKRRRDVLAEAMVARHLLSKDCELRCEVETPAGRTCDFEVRHAGRVFHLHVKRLTPVRQRSRQLTISSRLRSLEMIQRPYMVGIRWRPESADRQMQHLVREAEAFLVRARVGDELRVRDPEDGAEIGGVMVIAPSDGPRVTLVIGLPDGFTDEAPRVRRLMHRAYQQFMPRSLNLVLLAAGGTGDRPVVRDALLGSHEERWDAFPPRGRRVAHGRADDGFWAGDHYHDSRVAGWFRFDPARDALDAELIFRRTPAVSDADRDWLDGIFPSRG
ncbi:MAG: hypothetical protein AB8G96_11900 [Phycisphaerales bacterium]